MVPTIWLSNQERWVKVLNRDAHHLGRLNQPPLADLASPGEGQVCHDCIAERGLSFVGEVKGQC